MKTALNLDLGGSQTWTEPVSWPGPRPRKLHAEPPSQSGRPDGCPRTQVPRSSSVRLSPGVCAVAFRLIPKEEQFFDDFIAFGAEIRRGASLLEEMLAPDRPLWDKADEIKQVEHQCDTMTHEIIQRLYRTFVTPLDREDIFELARSLDDVVDAID